MTLLDKARSAAEQAAAKAKEGVEDVQTRKNLHAAYVDLGKKTFELVGAGAIEHAELTPLVESVTRLRAKLAGAEEAGQEPAAPEPPGEAL